MALALAGAGCGGGSDEPRRGTLGLTVVADRFARPTPLSVRFSAKPQNAVGEVNYRWRFDDGTQSDDRSPTHSFTRAGYYTVIVDARDQSGNNARQSLLLGAWPPRQWALGQTKSITPPYARRVQRVQERRTNERYADQREALRRRVAEG